jgi:RND family efflux transporter MFP subunit
MNARLSPLATRTLAGAALAALVQACLLLTGCGNKADDGPAAAPASAASGAAAAASAPPVGVTTVRAAQRDMPVLITATGTVAPLSSVEVRAQTTAPLGQVHVSEGQFVKAGQLLFTLDPRAEEANVAKARAQLARDEAALADAQRQLKRSEELLAQNFVSQGALDTNRTAVQSQAAAVAADKAALDAARLTLSYTRITAPGAGRLGAINVFPGSLVQANQTLLVTITQLDPITVSFSLPQRHLADALAALKDGGAPVTALLGDAPAAQPAARPASGASAPAATAPVQPSLQGRLKFVDNAVDAATGTVKVKAQFDNRDGKLWPGAFINVAMAARVIKDAVVLPQAAIVQSARGPVVYAVREGKAQPRPVQVLYAQGDDAAVSGLKAGERIVLEGRQNVRPGATVVERNREGSGGGGKGGAGSKPADGAASAGNVSTGNTKAPAP